MSQDDAYRTISAFSKGLYREKGSRFLAFAFPAYSEADVKEKLAQLRKEYHDARHHCYAYRLGFDKSVHRMNDDGEPSGTAGRPIFGQIVSHDLTQILIVVIRYFGGIKLGKPGLINAYRSAAKDALEQAVLIDRLVHEKYEIRFNYMEMNIVMRIIKEENAGIIRQEFGDSCQIVFSIRKNCGKKITERLKKISDISLSLLGEIG
jgi:uncharacterized YigZ family protein